MPFWAWTDGHFTLRVWDFTGNGALACCAVRVMRARLGQRWVNNQLFMGREGVAADF